MICVHIITKENEYKLQNVSNVIKINDSLFVISNNKIGLHINEKEIISLSVYDNDIYKVY